MAKQFPFPIAPHNYFAIYNLQAERREFLASEVTEPSFMYGPLFNKPRVNEYLAQVPPYSIAAKSLAVVLAAARLQDDEKGALEAFRQANLQLTHAPQKEYVMAIFNRISQKVTPQTQYLWSEVLEMAGQVTTSQVMAIPSSELFDRYRSYLERYITVPMTSEQSIVELIEAHLESTGLRSKGWSVKLRQGAGAAHTNHYAKWISIGERYRPRTALAKSLIVVHEVYGHALRGQQLSASESEGFAIVLEQLVDSRFKYRRSYRYLAVALGWGVIGKAMSFRQVFEILWRVMVIRGGYTRRSARIYAFDECCRAFRGGRPDIPGAVFLKDSVYFDANIAMWNVLIDRELSYNEFIDTIEGRRVLLV